MILETGKAITPYFPSTHVAIVDLVSEGEVYSFDFWWENGSAGP